MFFFRFPSFLLLLQAALLFGNKNNQVSAVSPLNIISDAFNELARVVSSGVTSWSLYESSGSEFDDEVNIFGAEAAEEENEDGNAVADALNAADMRVNAVLNVVSGTMASVVANANKAKKHADEVAAQALEEFTDSEENENTENAKTEKNEQETNEAEKQEETENTPQEAEKEKTAEAAGEQTPEDTPEKTEEKTKDKEPSQEESNAQKEEEKETEGETEKQENESAAAKFNEAAEDLTEQSEEEAAAAADAQAAAAAAVDFYEAKSEETAEAAQDSMQSASENFLGY